MTLKLVHVIWRHGDRSPTITYPTDPIKEDNWTFGGGGWGQLSPLGMKQHFDFGKQMRQYYVDTNFLSKTYNSKEIYVRSSDANRTIISAMTNLLGMYSYNNNASVNGTDYPDVDGWPQGFIPIAVHTIEKSTDHMLVSHAPCKRMSWLLEVLRNESEEVKGFLDRTEVKEVFKNVSLNAGWNYDVNSLWQVRDAWKIEHAHGMKQPDEGDWYTKELYDKVAVICDKIQLFDNGIYENPPIIIRNVDIGLELQKIRGGSLFNEINTHMNMKIDCLNRARPACRWINGLKYHAYSGHDTTIFAFLSIMGIQSKVVVSGGYPDYTAAAFVELYIDADGEPYFRILYRTSDVNNTIYPVTHLINECEGKDYCKLEVFRYFAAKSKPDQDLIEWCEMNPWEGTSSSKLTTIQATIFAAYMWYQS
ncbi:unnamed protein product [Cylicocyclus nassatus]|uniref:acid phosphatase n=1 Tax=Cylicocyclus nassatus TaxID=53992 RepID=A0AA36H9G4_CYLNA|nr:unnamed protein product [Cylicocyclus nassatus]